MYIGPFKITGKVNDNAYEVKMPDNCRHPVINVQWLKKWETRNGQFKKEPPRTKNERTKRRNEVTNIVAYDEKHKHFFCQMSNVDPKAIAEYSLAELSLLPKERRVQLVTDFNNLMDAQS